MREHKIVLEVDPAKLLPPEPAEMVLLKATGPLAGLVEGLPPGVKVTITIETPEPRP